MFQKMLQGGSGGGGKIVNDDYENSNISLSPSKSITIQVNGDKGTIIGISYITMVSAKLRISSWEIDYSSNAIKVLIQNTSTGSTQKGTLKIGIIYSSEVS